MLRGMLALAWVCSFAVLLPAQPGIDRSKDDKKEPLGDLNAGRPLPKGTLARLGSPRMRSRSDYSHGLQFSPNGKLLVLAASRDDLWWFDLATGRTLYQAEYPVGGIQCGRVFDDGSLLFFHSKSESDNTRHFLTRFDPKTAKIVSESKVEIASVDQSEIDRPGEKLYVLRDKLLLVTDTKTGEKLWSETLKQRPNGPPAFTPDGTKIIVGTETNIRLLDAKTGQTIRELDRPAEAKNGAGVSGLVASADNRWIAGVLHQECVVVWDAQTGRLKPTIAKQKLPLGFAPDGRLFSVALSGAVGI